jgi:hypothetical protein
MTRTHVTATAIDAPPGKLRLRVYQGGALVADVLLDWHGGLRLAADLLAHALLAERNATPPAERGNCRRIST